MTVTCTKQAKSMTHRGLSMSDFPAGMGWHHVENPKPAQDDSELKKFQQALNWSNSLHSTKTGVKRSGQLCVIQCLRACNRCP